MVLGKGSLAIKIAEWFNESKKYSLDLVVPSIPEPTWAPSLLHWCKANNIPTIDSGDYRDITFDGVDLAFSVFYSKMLDQEFISKCKRILNLHNAPLPKYRGMSPINWALKNNENSHGVTIHEITPGIDDGPIIAQLLYSIYPQFDEVSAVYGRALDYGWLLFKETMPLLDHIVPVPQDDAKSTYYSRKDNTKLGERRSWTKKESK